MPVRARAALVLAVLAVLVVLAGATRHASVAALAPQARDRLFDLVPRAHQSLLPIVAAPVIAGLLATVVLCVALGWILVRDPPATNA